MNHNVKAARKRVSRSYLIASYTLAFCSNQNCKEYKFIKDLADVCFIEIDANESANESNI